MYDIPTYPQLGRVYEGDYYEELPFGDYITKKEDLPNGENVFDIRDYGASSEEGYLNTEAFRLAAKACEKAGGGTILVAGGSYRMGTVWIPSNTTLYIAPDSEIVASRNADLLIEKNPEDQERFGTESNEGAFVRVKHAKNVTITGGGRINGSGEWFVYEPRELPALEPFDTTMLPRRDQKDCINTVPGTIRYYYRQRIRYAEDKYNEGKENLRRPSYMVWIEKSQDITVENIILHDSMTWTLNIDGCDRVTVKNVVIDDNRHVANTDGIDITGSSDVTVEHCFISCSDDGLCLKNPAYTNRAMERITIRDCKVITVMSAFKIGTGTRHDIRDVLLEDCEFSMPDIYPGMVTGLSIESCDGTHLSNVKIRNIRMDKVVCPLYIVLNMRNQSKEPYTDEVGANAYWGGSIDGVCIEHITAKDAELPSIITGFEAKKKDGTLVRRAVRNITVSDFSVVYRDNKEVLMIPETVEEFLYDYPESNAHGDVDAYGIWVRHADGLQLKNIQVTPRSCNTREMIKLYDVR